MQLKVWFIKMNITSFISDKKQKMNSSDVEACDSECWNLWTGFWIEGVILPLVAALGIAGIMILIKELKKKLILHEDE